MAVDNINQYQGNAALGQGTADSGIGPIGVYEMKNTNDAMDKLVQYQVLYNRDKWARNNLLVDRDAKEAAEQMKFTIGDWLQTDRDVIMGQINQMNELYKAYPNRTRLLSDGSNAKQVAEFQQASNEIQANIARANTRKQQDLALNQQYASATDEEDKAEILRWKSQYAKSSIKDDILLAPIIAPFTPLTTPDARKIETDAVFDKDKNVHTYWEITMPDMGAGMAQYSNLMNSTKGRKAREFVSKGLGDFNALLEKTKKEAYAQNPNATEQDIYQKLKSTEEGRTKLELLERANQLIKANNEYRGKTGTAEIDEVKWFNGLDENSYVKMLVGGGAKPVGREQKTSYPKLGVEEEQLRQGRVGLGLRSRELDQRIHEFNVAQENTKDPKVDPLIKNSAIVSLLTTPETGTAGADGLYNIPLTTSVKNMFAIPTDETETVIVNGEKQTTKKYTSEPIVSVKARKSESGLSDDTQIIVTYKDPQTDETREEVYDRAGLNIPGNNIFGAANSYKVGQADAEFKRGLGINNPTINQMFQNQQQQQSPQSPQQQPQQTQQGGYNTYSPTKPGPKPALGTEFNAMQTPITIENGKRFVDPKKMIANKWYINPFTKKAQRWTGTGWSDK